jgi:type I restriction enzyme M protein
MKKTTSGPPAPKIIVVPVQPAIGTRYSADYISGVQVRATPEETEAVQVFSQRLVEDYGYAKAQIQTRPQDRVRTRPSDEETEG